MAFPIRCFSCGKCIGIFEERYKDMREAGSTEKEALDTIGMQRYCCRRMFMGHVDIVDKLLLYSQHNEKPSEQKSKNPRE